MVVGRRVEGSYLNLGNQTLSYLSSHAPSKDGNAWIKKGGSLIRAKDSRLVVCFLVDVLEPFP